MAYNNYGGGYNRQGSGYNNGGNGYQGRTSTYRQPEPKKEFDLAEHIDTKLNVFLMFSEKAKEMGLEIPPEVLGGWCTSALISMEK